MQKKTEGEKNGEKSRGKQEHRDNWIGCAAAGWQADKMAGRLAGWVRQ